MAAITPQQAVAQLGRIGDPKAIARAVKNVFRRGANAIRKDSVARFRQRGVGRRIFGSRKFRQKHSAGLITVGRVREQGGSVELDITAKGMAAIQEKGGRTAPHEIRPKNALLLVFRVRGGLVKTKLVHHPGATHPKMPHLEPALEKGAPNVTREIEAAMEGHLDAALR